MSSYNSTSAYPQAVMTLCLYRMSPLIPSEYHGSTIILQTMAATPKRMNTLTAGRQSHLSMPAFLICWKTESIRLSFLLKHLQKQ